MFYHFNQIILSYRLLILVTISRTLASALHEISSKNESSSSPSSFSTNSTFQPNVPLQETSLLSWLFRKEKKDDTSTEDLGNDLFHIYYFGQTNLDKEIKLNQNSNLQDMPGFDANFFTIVIVHGWTSGYEENGWMDLYKNNLMQLYDHKLNILCIDWNPTSNDEFYPTPAKKTHAVGHSVAKWVHKLGVLSRLLMCVGHSLGAHVCGGFGEKYKLMTKELIYKIWGNDPAGPLFSGDNDWRLDHTKAKLVEIIHSNAGGVKTDNLAGLGISFPIGHYDFYLNNGQTQPGCPLVKKSGDPNCDHGRAHMYMAEKHESCIPIGFKCKNYDELISGKCVFCGDNNENCRQIVHLNMENNGGGNPPPEKVRYYLKTGSRTPGLCLNHYQLKFKMTNRMKALQGKFKVQLKSNAGQSEIIEFERSTLGDYFKPNKQYTQLVTSVKPLGPITSAEITFEVTGLNKFLCSVFSCKLGIVQMEANFASSLDASFRKENSGVLCTAEEDKSLKYKDKPHTFTMITCA